MSIGSIGSVPVPIQRPEANEGPGPDRVNDHDADDGAAVTQQTSSAKPPGTGQVVDVRA